MNIGILCHAGSGGSSRVAVGLAEGLTNRGHCVHLFTYAGTVGTWPVSDAVKVHRVALEATTEMRPGGLYTEWPSPTFHAVLAEIRRVAEGPGLDLVHFHYAYPFALLASALKEACGEASPVLVGTLHGSDVSVFGREPGIGEQLRKSLSQLAAVTTVSSSHARLAEEVLRLNRPVELIPNFVDLAVFRPHAGMEECGSNKGTWPAPVPTVDRRKRLIHISNFRPLKDVMSVARIFLGIREALDAELWVVGEGEDQARMRSWLERQGAGGRVRFFGFQEDVAPILTRTDLLLMASEQESFCLAALEAMACGVPVLATRVGGLPEVVLHGETGYLFPFRECATAVQYGVELLSNPELYRKMSLQAARRAQLLGREQIVPRYETLYERLTTPLLRPPRPAVG